MSTALQDAALSSPAPRTAEAHETRLRQLPLPDTTPPLELVVDDGPRRAPVTAVQGTLRLVVGPGDGFDPREDEDDFGPVPTGRVDLPDPLRWSRRLVQVLVEVMAGQRAATQLLRWTTPDVYERVRRLTVPPGRPGSTGLGGRSVRRPVVRSVRVCEPVDGVAEVSAVVIGTLRAHAVAVRLEGRDGRWRATALECG